MESWASFSRGPERSNCTRQQCQYIKVCFVHELECSADSPSQEGRSCTAPDTYMGGGGEVVRHRFSRSRREPATFRAVIRLLRPPPALSVCFPSCLSASSCPHNHSSSVQADQTKADIVTAHLSHSLNLFFFLRFVLSLPPASSSQQKIFSLNLETGH